ncbi:hypothetical protein AB0F52_14255 [Amycolatopsis sp. NPDC024027]|uniref:hypothetical protein n=1 Tax=Amycolatopsis sp. NPDC024027 TaxID=3154327 RepID=UPI0033C292AC
MTLANQRPASPFLRRIAEPPALATVFVSGRGRVTFLERAVELPATAMVVSVSERERVAFRERVVEPSVAAMAALVSGCSRIACREWVTGPSATAVVVFVSEYERVAFRERVVEPSATAMVISISERRRVVLRQQVLEPLASVGVAFAGDPDLRCSGAGGGMGPSELRQVRAFLLREVEPSAAAVVFVAECGRAVLQQQPLEPPTSAAAALAGDHEPVPMGSVRELVAA